jgi:hypothetical protein
MSLYLTAAQTKMYLDLKSIGNGAHSRYVEYLKGKCNPPPTPQERSSWSVGEIASAAISPDRFEWNRGNECLCQGWTSAEENSLIQMLTQEQIDNKSASQILDRSLASVQGKIRHIQSRLNPEPLTYQNRSSVVHQIDAQIFQGKGQGKITWISIDSLCSVLQIDPVVAEAFCNRYGRFHCPKKNIRWSKWLQSNEPIFNEAFFSFASEVTLDPIEAKRLKNWVKQTFAKSPPQ